jgi:phosphatidylserine/phosphatidylglycerophosphate/cardiolipin synthase-like enzyme
MQDLVTLLRQSLEDHVMVRSERKELKKEIATASLSAHQKNVLRSEIFKVAANQKEEVPTHLLLDWVQEAIKLTVQTNPNTPATSRSYFSPGTTCRDAITHHIQQAKQHIDICVFTISDNIIVDEILNAHQRKVKVRIISDNEKLFDKGSDIERLAKNGVPIKIDCSTGHMHHKYCLIDHNTLINVSYKWTRSAADRNYENIVVHQSPDLVKQFSRNFKELWNNLEHFTG